MIKTLNTNASSYWLVQKNNREHSFNKEIEFGRNAQKEDPLMNYPLRLCAYTNEVGAALSPIPVIGPKLFMLSWVPALLYFGADIYDKYAKGSENNYSEPSRRKALRQATFQALASVILPTAAVIVGQKAAGRLSAFIFKDGMEVGAKEDIINELKREINHDKLRNFKKDINRILKKNPSMSIAEIMELNGVKKIKNTLNDAIYKEMENESESIRHQRKSKSLLKRFIDVFAHSPQDCEHVSKLSPTGFQQKVKPYLKNKISELVEMRIKLQRALNPDGKFNNHSKDISENVLKEAQKILKTNSKNRNVLDKSNFVVKECVYNSLNKSAFKLSLIKIAGGFISLVLLAGPIDKFVEHFVISKIFSSNSNKSGQA